MTDKSRVLHSPNSACALQSDFLAIFKSFKYDYWVGGR